jgi:hypothetical protein
MHFDALYIALNITWHSHLREIQGRAHIFPTLHCKWASEEKMISSLKNCFIAHDACVFIKKSSFVRGLWYLIDCELATRRTLCVYPDNNSSIAI